MPVTVSDSFRHCECRLCRKQERSRIKGALVAALAVVLVAGLVAWARVRGWL